MSKGTSLFLQVPSNIYRLQSVVQRYKLSISDTQLQLIAAVTFPLRLSTRYQISSPFFVILLCLASFSPFFTYDKSFFHTFCVSIFYIFSFLLHKNQLCTCKDCVSFTLTHLFSSIHKVIVCFAVL